MIPEEILTLLSDKTVQHSDVTSLQQTISDRDKQEAVFWGSHLRDVLVMADEELCLWQSTD
jgi:hypothetical protein